MAFTYRVGEPDDRTRVRLLIGDTDPADVQLQDEEIDDMLLIQPNRYFAAAFCAELVGAKYARQSDYQAKNSISENVSQLQGHYAGLALRLRKMGARAGITPYAGGISQSDKDTRAADPDRVPTPLTSAMETEPGTEGTVIARTDGYPLT